MPTHTVPSAVIKLWTLGVPWDYPAWQVATGVQHGLFPDNPALLPKGWTPEDASNVKSYFDQYRLQPTEDDKIAFARQTKGSALPGRKKWRDWISALWRTSRIHERIIAVLHANNCHPLTLAVESSNGTTSWPMGGTWIPLCLDAVASELFGEDCLDQHGRLPESLRAPTQALVQRTWTNLTKRLDRGKKRIATLEEEAIQAFDGESSSRCNVIYLIDRSFVSSQISTTNWSPSPSFERSYALCLSGAISPRFSTRRII